jgi:Fis family transcriptional regulator, factor for inversion stimulation protein
VKAQLENLVFEMYRTGMQFKEALREFQRGFILTVLKDQKGNQCRAADRLGMHRNTLRRSIRLLQIDLTPIRDTTRRLPPRGAKAAWIKERVIASK